MKERETLTDEVREAVKRAVILLHQTGWPTAAEELLENATTKMLRELADKQDAWLLDLCRQTGMTPEELAERYYLETRPIVTVMDVDGVTFRATQEVRLKRRAPAHSHAPDTGMWAGCQACTAGGGG